MTSFADSAQFTSGQEAAIEVGSPKRRRARIDGRNNDREPRTAQMIMTWAQYYPRRNRCAFDESENRTEFGEFTVIHVSAQFDNPL